ncbi:MAG: hypothetical protein OEY29_14490 [Gammaproteobacteria bacterium]|nr:hypothetical protein [Gammaproteobacteria bacterium]
MGTNRDPYTWRGQKTTSDGQSLVQSESLTEARYHAGKGEVFILSSGFATTPAAADDFTNILYLKNDSTTDDINLGYLRTCSEVAGKWQWVEAPTALGATAITAINMNRGSRKTLTATIQSYSAAGVTFTDGTRTDYPQWIQGGPAHSLQPFEGSFIIGPGDSFGLEFAPFSATAGEACISLQLWQSAPET